MDEEIVTCISYLIVYFKSLLRRIRRNISYNSLIYWYEYLGREVCPYRWMIPVSVLWIRVQYSLCIGPSLLVYGHMSVLDYRYASVLRVYF